MKKKQTIADGAGIKCFHGMYHMDGPKTAKILKNVWTSNYLYLNVPLWFWFTNQAGKTHTHTHANYHLTSQNNIPWLHKRKIRKERGKEKAKDGDKK